MIATLTTINIPYLQSTLHGHSGTYIIILNQLLLAYSVHSREEGSSVDHSAIRQ